MANGNNGRQSLGLIAAHVLVALTVIVSSTVLVGLGKLTVEAYVTLLGAAIGLTGGAAGALVTAAYSRPAPGSTTVAPPQSGKTSTVTVTTDGHEGEVA